MILKRLEALRALMREHEVDVYIVPGNDPHASEYMAPHWAEMSWISGFLGETGTAVITMNKALLWTDSRYYLQAEAELKGTSFELMRESDVDCPSINDWLGLESRTTSLRQVGVNPEMYSVNDFKDLKEALEDKGIGLKSVDLIKPLWIEDRPSIPMNPLYIYEDQWTGESVESKVEKLRAKLAEKDCEAMVISALDEIGWIFNIRGTDVDYTPCVIAYALIEKERSTLFVDAAKIGEKEKAVLAQKGISVRGYEEVFEALQHLEAQGILYDGKRTNEALYEAINPAVTRRANVSPSPLLVMMSMKNEVELNGEREAMRIDAVALTRFFKWLDERFAADNRNSLPRETEISLAEKLGSFRAMAPTYREDSFCTIAGWKGNGAIVHYHATDEECATIEGDGVLLLDSGGQYLEGTTDITRTYWIGDESKISDQVKRDYTLVLKGHIALAKARFPQGTRGNQLDVLAHQFMWAEGITYGHGTGHGVGHFMGCHEGPANIRTDNNPNPIKEGNVFSDEPGIYRTNEYGIRIENLVIAVSAGDMGAHSTGEKYLEFETITLCFYDKRLMNMKMLTDAEKAWINQYHQRVYDEVAPRLNEQERAYLKHKCEAI